MNYTPNYNLNLSQENDFVRVAPFNSNFTLIDELLKENANAIKNVKVPTDQTYQPTSTNPQSGKAVAEAIAGVKVDTDSTVTEGSTNPVSGGAVKNYVDGEISTVEKSVEELTGIFDKSINLYNVDTNTVGITINATGVEAAQPSFSTSDYIFFEAGKSYYITSYDETGNKTTLNLSHLALFYADDKTKYRTRINSPTSPQNRSYDCYARLCGQTTKMKYIVVSEGVEPTEYVPYKNEIKPEYIPVDKTFNPESELAQSGKAVAEAISGVKINTDSTITENSTNPVTSGAVYNALLEFGMPQQAKSLLVQILTNSIYANDQSTNIKSLAELFSIEVELPDDGNQPDVNNDPWEYGKYLTYDGRPALKEAENWLVSPYIPITPGIEMTVHTQANFVGGSTRAIMTYAYSSDKTKVGYITENKATVVETINDLPVYEKITPASDLTEYAFVRVNIRKDAYQYCKVWQNGELIFDGSQYPPTK